MPTQTVAELAGIDLNQWQSAVGTLAFKKFQKEATPSPGAGDRVFYESAYRENQSPLSLIWCIEHGVFLQAEHDSLISAYENAKSGKKGAYVPGVKTAAHSAAAAAAKPVAVQPVAVVDAADDDEDEDDEDAEEDFDVADDESS